MINVFHTVGVFVDDDDRFAMLNEAVDHCSSDSSESAHDGVTLKSVNHFVHSSPSDKLAQLAFNDCLYSQCERVQHRRNAGGDDDHGEYLFTIRRLSTD